MHCRFLVAQMVSLNAFGCPRSSAEEYRAFMTGKKSECSEPGYDSTGFWIMASHINHSCLPNASRSFIGNFMIVRAARDMKSGEELTWGYVSPSLSQEERQKKLSHWGFVCDCQLCEAERATPKEKQRKRATLLKKLEAIFANSTQWQSSMTLSSKDLEKSIKLLNELKETYAFPPSKQPRFTLFEPFLGLARCYRRQNRPHDVIAMANEALASLGFEFQKVDQHLRIVRWGFLNRHVVETFRHLENAYRTFGNKKFKDDTAAFARKAYAILEGESESFDEVHGSEEPF
jgi:hypothetical protein